MAAARSHPHPVPEGWLRPGACWALLAVAAGCASGPTEITDPVESLEQARLALAGGRADAALAILQQMEGTILPRDLGPRYVYTLARCHYVLGDPWQAYQELRDFAEDFPLADERPDVQSLLFEMGRELARSDHYVPVFADHRRDGRVILEHLISNFEGTPDRDDALHLLGDIAYVDGDFEEANRRYQELIRDFRDSEWNELARFRVAMTRFHELRGPGYDLAAMTTAREDLQTLLENPPDRPTLVAEAQAALGTVTEWIAEHHLGTADYYHTLANRTGEVIHLRRAALENGGATPAGTQAIARLQSMGEPLVAPTGPAPGQP